MATSTELPTLSLLEFVGNATGLKGDTVDQVLDDLEITGGARTAGPNKEQEERALNKPAGLRGKALARYIVTGEGTREQTNGAKEEREEQQREQGNGRQAATGPREGSMTWAMLEVLKGRRKGMTAKELTAEIQQRNLAPGLKGKTPDATVGAKLATEAKKPHGLFKRTAPGKYLARSPSIADQAAKAGRARQAQK